jgi:hypothetical protein
MIPEGLKFTSTTIEGGDFELSSAGLLGLRGKPFRDRENP